MGAHGERPVARGAQAGTEAEGCAGLDFNEDLLSISFEIIEEKHV